MAAGREPLAAHYYYARVYAGKRGGKLDKVHPAETAALHGGFIMPAYPEKVERVNVPQADVFKRLFNVFRYEGRVLHLRKGRYKYVAFLGAVYGVLQPFFVHGKVYHGHSPLL